MSDQFWIRRDPPLKKERPPDPTPGEREDEERWIERQYRKHCPWWIRLSKFIDRLFF
jgi:hypothetical protein